MGIKLENIDYFFHFTTILDQVFKPIENKDISDTFLAKENIFARENYQKINDWISDYKVNFIDFIKKSSGYQLNFDEESLIVLDIFLSDDKIEEWINNLQSEYEIHKFLFEWVGYIGSFFLFYLKKHLRIPPKVEYPLHKTYFSVNGLKIEPFILAMKKISRDENFSIYEYISEILQEDFKADKDYIEDVKNRLKPFWVKWIFGQTN